MALLLARGHAVTAAVRDPRSVVRRFPGIRAVHADMARMLSSREWLPLLSGLDAVVNCAGVLQSRRGQSATAIHATAPKALFDACLAVGVRRVVQISAVSADTEAGTEFALTKKAADDYLRGLDLDWVVLRPSLVYAQGSYGGTSIIRGLAGLPFLIPLIGDGEQLFQPIHADDLAEAVVRCLEQAALARRALDPVGPETVSLRSLLAATRAWLDLPGARVVRVPRWLVGVLARLGDMFGSGPITTTSVAQLDYGNVSDAAGFEAEIGFRPRTMAEAFRDAPSHVQDRWHARLYFLRPLLTAALALLWLGSGIVGLLGQPAELASIGRALDLPPGFVHVAAVAFSLLDIAIGTMLTTGRGGRGLGFLQLVVVGTYTVGLGSIRPSLWIDPYGPLLKNFSLLVAVAIWTALRNDR